MAEDLTEQQEDLMRERTEQGVCPVCGYTPAYCGGPMAHLRRDRQQKLNDAIKERREGK